MEMMGFQLLLHGDGDGMQNRKKVGVADGHSNGEAVQMIVNKEQCRCFKLCTAATYKSRKKDREGCCGCNCYLRMKTAATGKNN